MRLQHRAGCDLRPSDLHRRKLEPWSTHRDFKTTGAQPMANVEAGRFDDSVAFPEGTRCPTAGPQARLELRETLPSLRRS